MARAPTPDHNGCERAAPQDIMEQLAREVLGTVGVDDPWKNTHLSCTKVGVRLGAEDDDTKAEREHADDEPAGA